MPDTTDHSENPETNEALGQEAVRRARLIIENAKWFFENGVSVAIKKDRKTQKLLVSFDAMHRRRRNSRRPSSNS